MAQVGKCLQAAAMAEEISDSMDTVSYTHLKAAKILHQDKWLFYAERAYCYLTDFFEDKEYGGYFTQVGPDGQVLDSTKKMCIRDRYGAGIYDSSGKLDVGWV